MFEVSPFLSPLARSTVRPFLFVAAKQKLCSVPKLEASVDNLLTVGGSRALLYGSGFERLYPS
jgi:hypothetical protein